MTAGETLALQAQFSERLGRLFRQMLLYIVRVSRELAAAISRVNKPLFLEQRFTAILIHFEIAVRKTSRLTYTARPSGAMPHAFVDE